MALTAQKFVDMIDSVAINPRDTFEDIRNLAECARKYNYFCVYGIASYNDYMLQALKGTRTIVGGAIGNTTGVGEEPLEVKKYMAQLWLDKGCGEFDMFMNVPFLRSGMYDEVKKEVRAIREMTRGKVLKVIIQTPLLNDDQIRIASELIVDAECDFVKTGAGFYGPTTVEAVKVIKETIGNRGQIKAAGGIVGLPMVEELIDLGVTRFGMSNAKTVAVIEELEKRG